MFSLEHSKTAYWGDFVFYAWVIAGLTCCVAILAPRAQSVAMFALATMGLGAWSLVEYAMHRFVLHGVEPFRTWHASHHWRANGEWLKERKRWHAIHHRRAGGACYGVTTTVWDRVFGTGPGR